MSLWTANMRIHCIWIGIISFKVFLNLSYTFVLKMFCFKQSVFKRSCTAISFGMSITIHAFISFKFL